MRLYDGARAGWRAKIVEDDEEPEMGAYVV